MLHSVTKPRLCAALSRDDDGDGEGGGGLGVLGKPVTGMAGGWNNSGSDEAESSSNKPRSEVGRRPGARGLTVEEEGDELSDPVPRNRSWFPERLSLAERLRTVSNSQGFTSFIALCGCILYVKLSNACNVKLEEAHSLCSSCSQSNGSARLAREPPLCTQESYRKMRSRRTYIFSLATDLIHFVLPSSSAVRRYRKVPMNNRSDYRMLTHIIW